MGIDIQKNINSNNIKQNFQSKPVEVKKNSASNKVDEEKSNAAKLMIGLTATAAIVIGGLYAAKHGKLGETAQKYANKIFGEAPVKKAATSSSDTPSVPDIKSISTLSAAALLAIPKLSRKLIKNPHIKLDKFAQELQGAEVAFERSEDPATKLIKLVVKGAKETDAPAIFHFNADGTIKSIERTVQKSFKNGNIENTPMTYLFEKGKLAGVKKGLTTPSKSPEIKLSECFEFAGDGKIAKKFYELHNPKDLNFCHARLEKVSGEDHLFTCSNPDHYKYLIKNFDELPQELKVARFVKSKEVLKYDKQNCQIITLDSFRFYTKPLNELPAEIPSEELVRAYHRANSTDFQMAVNELDHWRKNVVRTVEGRFYPPTPQSVIEHCSSGFDAHIKPDNVRDIVHTSDLVPCELREAITNLIVEDMKGLQFTSSKAIDELSMRYARTFKAYNLETEQHAKIVGKTIKECSNNEFLVILKQVAPEKFGNIDEIEFAGKNLLNAIKSQTGRSEITEDMKIFDILKYLK